MRNGLLQICMSYMKFTNLIMIYYCTLLYINQGIILIVYPLGQTAKKKEGGRKTLLYLKQGRPSPLCLYKSFFHQGKSILFRTVLGSRYLAPCSRLRLPLKKVYIRLPIFLFLGFGIFFQSFLLDSAPAPYKQIYRLRLQFQLPITSFTGSEFL